MDASNSPLDQAAPPPPRCSDASPPPIHCAAAARTPGPGMLVSTSGWWYSYPSEKSEFVNWDDEIPN